MPRFSDWRVEQSSRKASELSKLGSPPQQPEVFPVTSLSSELRSLLRIACSTDSTLASQPSPAHRPVIDARYSIDLKAIRCLGIGQLEAPNRALTNQRQATNCPLGSGSPPCTAVSTPLIRNRAASPPQHFWNETARLVARLDEGAIFVDNQLPSFYRLISFLPVFSM